jgi:uncharacterized protein (TIGR03084 family)
MDPSGMEYICADLAAEHAGLDALVADLDDSAWNTPTPAAPWRVRDQIGHLAYYDKTALAALEDASAFAEELAAIAGDADTYRRRAEALGRDHSGAALLGLWREGRHALLNALRHRDARDRIEWYGPSMSARSFATARLMETWAHGTDVADALGTSLQATDRLRHIAHLGVRTRGWSYVAHGREAPDDDVHVALRSPAGDTWEWGDAAVADHVSGPALDFCLVVTQRRVVDDTALEVVGDLAHEWLRLALAFAGPPTITAAERRGLDVASA